MKTLKLNLDFRLPTDSKEDNAELTASYIAAAVGLKYKEGLEGQLRRQWGKIQRDLDNALAEKKEELELEDSDFDFIKKAVLDEKVKFPANIAKYINVLEDELDTK